MVGMDIVGCEIPFNVELKVVETVPGVRGDTASGATKPAKVQTGAMVNVPLFINEGDIIRVDTRTGQYLERVKKLGGPIHTLSPLGVHERALELSSFNTTPGLSWILHTSRR